MVAAVLGVLDRFSPEPRDRHRPLTWHRFTEALKVKHRNIDGHTVLGTPNRDYPKNLTIDASLFAFLVTT